MKTSTMQAGNPRPIINRIAAALTVAAVLGGMAMTPALAKDHGDRHDNGWHKGEWKGDRERSEYVYRPVYPYYYSQPVYAPPPVYYYPQQSPGISFFFPLDVRR